MLIDKSPNPRKPLREPRSIIKKRPDFLERPIIEGDNPGAKPAHGFDRAHIKRGTFLVVIKFALILRKHANARAR